jgi:Aldo/keto reductase family
VRRPLGPFSVSAIGFGAMRLTGPGVFGPPKDHDEALAVLREAVDSGVDHIDTAQFYGPDVVNELIREALYPYPEDLILVSKVGARRDRNGRVLAAQEPAQLRQGIQDNLRTLGIDALPVVNLRLIGGSEPDDFFDDQLAAMIAARDDGLITAIGLSNITSAHLLHALRVTDVACVQNEFHLANRVSQPCWTSAPGGGSRLCRLHRWASVCPARTLSSAGPALCGKRHVWASRRRRSRWRGRWPSPRTCCSSLGRPPGVICGRTWRRQVSILTPTLSDGCPPCEPNRRRAERR